MKNRIISGSRLPKEKIITTFGRARLVRLNQGSAELRGGDSSDRTMAKEWISMFMHEAVMRSPR